jgi:hypothetical protein
MYAMEKERANGAVDEWAGSSTPEARLRSRSGLSVLTRSNHETMELFYEPSNLNSIPTPWESSPDFSHYYLSFPAPLLLKCGSLVTSSAQQT